MKVIFQSRTTLFSGPGGDTIQIVKTANALRNKGWGVTISTELEPSVSNYDIVHLFNLIRPQETYLQAINAKNQGKKVALSTIYVDYSEYERNSRGGLLGGVANKIKSDHFEYLKVMARAVKNKEINKGTLYVLRYGFKTLQSKIVDTVDILMPNSYSERKRLLEYLPTAINKKYIVVPNGVDIHLFDPKKVIITKEAEKYRSCILCVARIEGLKSQLNLIRAMKDLPWPLVLIGKPAPNHISYFEKVKNEASKNVFILGHIEHDLLPQYYSVAKVHVLISWMETTGLSSLEAAMMGCNLVVTDKGDVKDYFGDYAYYCRPDSVESIRDAIVKAFIAPPNPKLREHVLNNYTWEIAAQRTLEGYSSLW